MANPWIKFYTSDWRADPCLRMCSAAARGLWIEIICLMHEAEPYGHLVIAGQSPTDAQLATLAGIPPEQIPELLGELESAGVFSRARKGVIYSRKMTRDKKKADLSRKNGNKGGNPSLSKQTEKTPRDNPPIKGEVKAQKPEARSQIEEESKASSSKNAEEDFYQKYLDAHPNPVETKAGEDAWDALIADGVDPAQIVASAATYAVKSKSFSNRNFIQQSDNFLDPDRGKWKSHAPSKAGKAASLAEKLDFYANLILDKRPTAASVVSPQMVGRLLAAERVTKDQLKEAGISV